MLLRRNAKCYEEKSYHFQISHRLKVKPSFHEKLFQKEKNKLLLWVYSRRLSGHLWFNDRQKSPVAGLNWNPCLRKLILNSWEILRQISATKIDWSQVESNKSSFHYKKHLWGVVAQTCKSRKYVYSWTLFKVLLLRNSQG